MLEGSLRSLRDLLSERPQGLTFADLPGTVLEDLALGWAGGRRMAEVAAQMASRIDGIRIEGRDREIAGRALLTLLARRGAKLDVRTPPDSVRLLGNPSADEGDPEAIAAYTRREEQYRSLDALPTEYALDDYTTDLAGAFEAAREESGTGLPPDDVAADHALALLATRLPPGLRAWFHRRYDASRADALAWKFVLVGRALAHHRAGMLETGVLRRLGDPDPAVPQALADSLLKLGLGELARTAILEPVI